MPQVKKQKRAAFLLNANAKSVTKALHKKLAALIPEQDLFLSRCMDEANEHIDRILEEGYAYLFSGGGDGTAIFAINAIAHYQAQHPYAPIPALGVLRLGTGNALARFLGAKAVEDDITDVLGGASIKPVALSLIETERGDLSPFAGIGYDGELMNDFESVKEIFFESPFRKMFSSLAGFTMAGLLKTIPRQIARELPKIRVSTSKPYYHLQPKNGADEEIYMDKGEVIYHDVAPLICVGTIPYVGYGITMFPFANKRPGYMHLRISAVPISVCLLNMYPAIWHGGFRHKKLFDFLVKDVLIEADESLPYQLGGDAMGYRKKLNFKVRNPVTMAAIDRNKRKVGGLQKPVMMPLI